MSNVSTLYLRVLPTELSNVQNKECGCMTLARLICDVVDESEHQMHRNLRQMRLPNLLTCLEDDGFYTCG